MKIIIAGAGAVGTHLAKLLSREQHDITLIDESQERLNSLGYDSDLLTVNKSPSSISALQSADVGKADLFIGVTPDEAHNMTCCMLASKLGASRTVARVDNYEYTLPEHREFFHTVGIDSIIYPEMLAGEEIIRNIQHSWVRQWMEVQDGNLLMLGVKLRKGASVLDKPLRELCGPDAPYHVVAVKREQETLIPHGNDILMDRDVAYFMTTRPYISLIQEIAGKKDYPEVKNIFLMGGGSTTVQALRMLPENMRATVVEKDRHRCERLSEMFPNRRILILHGDGRDLDFLSDEGLGRADAFAALTDNSEANILTCLSAKRMGVRKTVAMVENMDYIPMAESLDIGTIINKKTFAASHIYQMMLKADVTTMKTLTVANADVAEFVVKGNSRITRKPVKDLNLPDSVNLGGLVRNGQGELINGMTTLLPGDTVVAFCLENSIQRVEKYFK